METKEPLATASHNHYSETLTAKKKSLVGSRMSVILAGLFGVLLVAVLSFGFGFSAGIRKAHFSERWDDNYGKRYLNLPGPMGGPGMISRDMDKGPMRSGYGTAGRIIGLSEWLITIESPEGNEHAVTVTGKTRIKKKGDPIEFSGLEVEDRIIVLGKPREDGSIEADFIRAVGKDDAERVEQVMKDTGMGPMSDMK